MNISNYFKNCLPLGFSIFLLIVALKVNNSYQKPYIVIPKQSNAWNLNAKMLQNYHLGLRRLESSFLWISTIIESDIDHYKQRDLNSWMFLRFNTISMLEPKFYENYSFGGIYLSVIKDDLEGASIIFNKGLEIYPKDYKLLKDASYHFFYEIRDYKRSFQLTQTLKKNFNYQLPLVGMITKLEAENGKLEEALLTLTQYQNNYPKGSVIGDKIFKNRYSLKAEIDLSCLNSKVQTNCSLLDLNNMPYIKFNNLFKAQSDWQPYRRKSFIKK